MKILFQPQITPITNNLKSNFSNNISFKSDSFERESENDNIDECYKQLKQRKERILTEIQQSQNSIFDSVTEKLENQNRKIAELRQEYELINRLLSKSSDNSAMKDSRIILAFLNSLDNMQPNVGFNRISGYDGIKNQLKNEFILKTMMMAKTSQSESVPNALLVYGLTNNGKTTFAKALAEQSLCNLFPAPDLGKITEKQAMAMIYDYGRAANEIYEKSGDKKTRSIILINEADIICNEDSEIFNEFMEFAQNCSQKYKCTLFLTTNHPNDIDSKILSPKMTPVKIGIPLADKKTCRKIVLDKLKALNKIPAEGIENLVEEFYKNPDKRYSNGNIISVLNETLKTYSNPTEEDFLTTLKYGHTRPSIGKKELNNFIINKQYFEQNQN